MADKGKDPIELWQSMIGEMEKGFNAFTQKAMASPEFSKVVEQVGGVSAGAQKQLGELMERYLASLNLPSREQMAAIDDRLAVIESRLDEIAALLKKQREPPNPPQPKAASQPPRVRRPRTPPTAG